MEEIQSAGMMRPDSDGVCAMRECGSEHSVQGGLSREERVLPWMF